MRDLSELEGCVLGLLWKHGPCTAYTIRREMLNSQSSHWSGSAGAIYPLLQRLEKRRVVVSHQTARGDRPHRLYELTSRGRDQFMAWLAPPFDHEIISIAPDPLRTRMFFLGALSPRQRATFLAEARAKLAQYAGKLSPEPEADTFDRLAIRGAVRSTRARMEWIAEVERALKARKREKKRQRLLRRVVLR